MWCLHCVLVIKFCSFVPRQTVSWEWDGTLCSSRYSYQWYWLIAYREEKSVWRTRLSWCYTLTSTLTFGVDGYSWSYSRLVIQLLVLCNCQLLFLFPLKHPSSCVLFHFIFIWIFCTKHEAFRTSSSQQLCAFTLTYKLKNIMSMADIMW